MTRGLSRCNTDISDEWADRQEHSVTLAFAHKQHITPSFNYLMNTGGNSSLSEVWKRFWGFKKKKKKTALQVSIIYLFMLLSRKWEEGVCTNLGTHIWGRRRTPALERTQTGLTFHRQMSCRKWVPSRPWSVYLRRPQPCKHQSKIKNLSVHSYTAVKRTLITLFTL